MRFSRIQINNFYNLKDVDLDLSSGSTLIVGPNGSGKSNIIKCVHKLVESLTDDTSASFYRRIWNVGKVWTDTYIKIEANLNRKEAELFSWFHATVVTYEVAAAALEISKAVYSKMKERCREMSEPIVSRRRYGSPPEISEKDYNDLFREFTSDILFRYSVSQEPAEVVFKKVFVKSGESYRFDDRKDTAISKDRILEICFKELYPKLRELSNKSPKDNQGLSSSDVEFSAVLVDKERFVKKFWLTKDLKLPGDVAAQKKAVVEVLRKIFGGFDIERFDISATANGVGFTPFKLAVQSDEEIVTVQPLPNQVLFNQSDMSTLMGPDMRKMFFSTGLYFVEGETDKKVLSALRHYIMNHARPIRRDSRSHPNLHEHQEAVDIIAMDNWDILSLGGCDFALKAYKAAKALKIPCAVVLDEDTITGKHGKIVKPFTKHNWEKSNLCKELKRNESSFSEASALLEDIQSAFEKFEEIEMREEARTILQKYGFWVWSGDLEGIIFDNKDAREEIKKLNEFVNFVLSKNMFYHSGISERNVISRNEALENFDERDQDPLESVLDELKTELSAARDAKDDAYSTSSIDPRRPVTDKLQSTLQSSRAKLADIRQKAIKYDEFCQKGTKRSVEGEAPQKKHFKKSPKDDQPEELILMDEEKNQRAMLVSRGEEGNELAMPVFREEADQLAMPLSPNEETFWKDAKKQLHDRGGWKKVPDAMMQNIIGACLKDGHESKNPLAEFLRFMERHQMRNQNINQRKSKESS